MAQWQMTPQQSDKRAQNDFSGGVNNGTPSLFIQDTQTSDEYGADTFDYPAWSVRKGRTAYGASGGGNTNLLANYENKYMVRAVGTKMQYDNAGTWTDITGATGLTSADFDYTNFNGKIIMTNGTDNVKYWDGTTFGDLNATTAPKGRFIANNTIRVYICVGDVIHFSKYLDETNWDDPNLAGFFEYYTPDGGDITALVLYQNLLVAFKQNAFAEIQSTGESSIKHRLLPISSQVGCVCNKTIQEVRGVLYWLGMTDVYMFSGGQPAPIGQNVKKIIDSINATYWSKCFSGTDGQRYYLGLVTGTNTEPDTMLVYDTKFGVWRIYSISLGSLRYASFINGQWYAGDNAGQTFKMNSGTTDNGTAIPWQLTSRTFDEGVSEAEKEYFEMHLQMYLPSGSTMTLGVGTDDRSTSFTQIDTLTTGTAAQNSNNIVPLDTVPITNFMRYQVSGTGPATIYKAERYFRIHPVQI